MNLMHKKQTLTIALCGLAAVGLLAAFLVFSSPALGDGSINATSIEVTTTQDELLVDGDCSLREALRAANTDQAYDACPAGDGADTILIPTGVYTTTILGLNEDQGLTGDLDILQSVSIQGMGADNTIVDGGGIDRVFHNYSGQSVSFLRLTIRHGKASDSTLNGGGGILNTGGEMRVTECVLQENQAVGGTGGGIDNHNNLIIQNSSFISNTTDVSGGGVSNGGTLFLYDSTFHGNTGTNGGGGVDNSQQAFIRNITFYNNSSNSGGALFNDGTLNMVNCTLVNNSNGIDNNSLSLQLKNTIIVNNSGINNCGGTFGISSAGHNLESGDSCNFRDVAGDQINVADAMLGPLSNNGGSTKTFSLLEGSPAIDAGDNVDCSGTDQRGASRPVDGNGDFLKKCDIGSYELFGLNPIFVYLPLIQK
jgi:CSLREA domain-containing protein